MGILFGFECDTCGDKHCDCSYEERNKNSIEAAKLKIPPHYYKLDMRDLRNLVRSQTPKGYQGAMEYNKMGAGELTGFPNEKWYWKQSYLESLTEEQLWNLYIKLKL